VGRISRNSSISSCFSFLQYSYIISTIIVWFTRTIRKAYIPYFF